VLAVTGGLPAREGDRVVGGLGIAGPDRAVRQETAEAALG